MKKIMSLVFCISESLTKRLKTLFLWNHSVLLGMCISLAHPTTFMLTVWFYIMCKIVNSHAVLLPLKLLMLLTVTLAIKNSIKWIQIFRQHSICIKTVSCFILSLRIKMHLIYVKNLLSCEVKLNISSVLSVVLLRSCGVYRSL